MSAFANHVPPSDTTILGSAIRFKDADNFEVSYEEPQVDVEAEPATEAPAETAEAGSNNTAPIVIGIVVIAAAVVIIIVVAKKNAKNK